MANKYCSKCGAEMPEEAMFCTKCGKPFDEGAAIQSKREHKVNKKTVYALLGTLSVLFLVVLGAMFYSEYSEAREERLAREKFVADSLEQVRKDSIKLAEQKEQERIEAERISAMREELSWERVLALMNNIKNKSLAKKCGLEEIYKYEYYHEGEEDEPTEAFDIEIYGREVKKGTVSEEYAYASVDIISNSDHSCYLKHVCASDCGYTIAFKDNEDANYFFNKVTENGVIKSNGNYLIPKKKKFKGIRESDNWEYEDIAYGMSEVQYSEGWYIILFSTY